MVPAVLNVVLFEMVPDEVAGVSVPVPSKLNRVVPVIAPLDPLCVNPAPILIWNPFTVTELPIVRRPSTSQLSASVYVRLVFSVSAFGHVLALLVSVAVLATVRPDAPLIVIAATSVTLPEMVNPAVIVIVLAYPVKFSVSPTPAVSTVQTGLLTVKKTSSVE